MIEDVRRKYAEAFGMYGDDDRSVFFPKGRQFQRYESLLPAGIPAKFSLLDFGCGLGKMVLWLEATERNNIEYHGADITPDFIEHNRKKFPASHFHLIQSPADLKQEWDVILASGVFSILYSSDRASHQNYVFETLESLFKNNTKKILSFDFMHTEVDYQQEGAFHASVSEVEDFVKRKLSKRYEIIRSHMPYEFSVRVWKDLTITADGVYQDWV